MLLDYETFVHSVRLELNLGKRGNLANAFFKLILIVCALPTWANHFSTSKLINYVEYDDQEYAENKYLEMGPMRHYKKLLYKTVPVNDSSVCNMTSADAFKVCHEIALYRKSRNAMQNQYTILRSEEPDECKEYKLKLDWDYREEKRVEFVIARKCPTKPTLYMSDGKNIGGVFVYVTRQKNRKDLKLMDYITFVERTTPIVSRNHTIVVSPDGR